MSGDGDKPGWEAANPPPRSYSSLRRFFAGLLLAAGALLILLSGGCTLSIIIDDPSWMWLAIFAGMFGLTPGIGLCIVGRQLWRE